jgi:hypothetical protein
MPSINHAGVDLLRVHLDGQEAYAGVQRLELVVHVRERRVGVPPEAATGGSRYACRPCCTWKSRSVSAAAWSGEQPHVVRSRPTTTVHLVAWARGLVGTVDSVGASPCSSRG